MGGSRLKRSVGCDTHLVAWHGPTISFPHHCAAPLFLFFGATHRTMQVSSQSRGSFHCSLELRRTRVGDALFAPILPCCLFPLFWYHVVRNGTETDPPLFSLTLLRASLLFASVKRLLGLCCSTLIYTTAIAGSQPYPSNFPPLWHCSCP